LLSAAWTGSDAEQVSVMDADGLPVPPATSLYVTPAVMPFDVV
jgi:hypothetical protein